MSEEQKKKKRPQRQEWRPNVLFAAAYGAWRVVFGAAKIVLGAAATVVIILAICMLAFAGALGDYLTDEIIPHAGMNLDEFTLDQTSFVYYFDNGEIKLLQQIHTSTDRQWADYEDIPEDLINATIAIEDKRFYEHQGVDWFTTIKAFANMFMGDDSKGGSTITQQLVKNLTKDDSVTVQRKLLEIFRATDMERRYDKDVIMEWYLNYIYLGHGCYGVRSAAETYFGKELEMLTTAECASLISITNNPSVYDPYGDEWVTEDEETGEVVKVTTGESRNNYRKEWTLGEMVTQGLITRDEYDEAMEQELVFKSGIEDGDRLTTCSSETCGYENIASAFELVEGIYYCPNCGSPVTVHSDASQDVYSWFVDTALEDVAMALCERDGLTWSTEKGGTRTVYMDLIARGGFHIYTTLDMDVQNQVDLIYEDLDEIPETRSGQQLQSAIVVIDNVTGDIVAMAGGVGEKTVHDGWNIATDAVLQTGSSIKPLTVYAPAFEAGAITPASVIKDLPIRFDDEDPYPNNDNLQFSYTRSIQSGVKSSVNCIAANVLEMIGAEYAYEFGKYEFGLTSLIDEYVDEDGRVHDDRNVGALAMGSQTFGLSVREMSNAYSAFANDGVYREGRTFTKVFDSEGNLVLENAQDSRTILSKKTVDYMNSCLFEAAARGTGTEADIYDQYVYGKTGTTNNAKDRWFCGFTKYYTAAVWTGYNDPERIRPLYVNNPAAVLWNKVMEPLHEGLEMTRLYDNSVFVNQTICLDSGLLATDACKADLRNSDTCTRVDTVRVYREDQIKESCQHHVMMDICPESGAVANEWCQHFASEEYKDVATRLKLEKRALCKITREELDKMLEVKDKGLWEEFLQEGWVYLVDKNGRDDKTYKGFMKDTKVNEKVESPYSVCPIHTKEAWEAYLGTQPTQPTDPTDPTAPTTPTTPGTGEDGSILDLILDGLGNLFG